MNGFCRGKPRVLKTITEEIGRRFEVNPALINLDRVERINVSMWHVGLASPVPNSQSERDMYQSGCRGIFYTPKGPLSCNIHFNRDGIVTNICEDSIFGGVGDKKATTLFASELLKDLYWKFAPQTPAPVNRPGQTCYDLGTGRTKACDN